MKLAAPVTKSFEIANTQVRLSIGVGVLVALALAISYHQAKELDVLRGAGRYGDFGDRDRGIRLRCVEDHHHPGSSAAVLYVDTNLPPVASTKLLACSLRGRRAGDNRMRPTGRAGWTRGNILLFPRARNWQREGPELCRERLEGLLRCYHREAA